VLSYEFKKLPSELLKCGIPEYTFMASGLEWWKTKEKEAMDNARH
jgi:hypothetical protein